MKATPKQPSLGKLLEQVYKIGFAAGSSAGERASELEESCWRVSKLTQPIIRNALSTAEQPPQVGGLHVGDGFIWDGVRVLSVAPTMVTYALLEAKKEFAALRTAEQQPEVGGDAVERVARAIHNACAEIEKPYPTAIPCYSASKHKDEWRLMAKAAIAALQQPAPQAVTGGA